MDCLFWGFKKQNWGSGPLKESRENHLKGSQNVVYSPPSPLCLIKPRPFVDRLICSKTALVMTKAGWWQLVILFLSSRNNSVSATDRCWLVHFDVQCKVWYQMADYTSSLQGLLTKQKPGVTCFHFHIWFTRRECTMYINCPKFGYTL